MSENWAETHQSCRLAPDWKAYSPLLMGSGNCWYRFRRCAAKNLVAIEATRCILSQAGQPKWKSRLVGI